MSQQAIPPLHEPSHLLPIKHLHHSTSTHGCHSNKPFEQTIPPLHMVAIQSSHQNKPFHLYTWSPAIQTNSYSHSNQPLELTALHIMVTSHPTCGHQPFELNGYSYVNYSHSNKQTMVTSYTTTSKRGHQPFEQTTTAAIQTHQPFEHRSNQPSSLPSTTATPLLHEPFCKGCFVLVVMMAAWLWWSSQWLLCRGHRDACFVVIWLLLKHQQQTTTPQTRVEHNRMTHIEHMLAVNHSNNPDAKNETNG